MVERALQHHPRHVDQDVHLSHRLDRVAGQRPDRRFTPHVCRQSEHRVGAAQAQELIHGPFHARGVEVGDDHARSLPREGSGDHPSDAACAADDDRDLARERTARQFVSCHSGHSIQRAKGFRRLETVEDRYSRRQHVVELDQNDQGDTDPRWEDQAKQRGHPV